MRIWLISTLIHCFKASRPWASAPTCTFGLNIDTTVSMSRASKARAYLDTSCWIAAYDSIRSSRSSIVVGFQSPKR